MHHSEQKCAHFCSEWCFVGYGADASWDMWICSLDITSFPVRARYGIYFQFKYGPMFYLCRCCVVSCKTGPCYDGTHKTYIICVMCCRNHRFEGQGLAINAYPLLLSWVQNGCPHAVRAALICFSTAWWVVFQNIHEIMVANIIWVVRFQ